jgi:hypothetical protein
MMKSRMVKCDRAALVAPKQICKQVWNQVWTKPIKQVALAGALGLIALASLPPDVARAEDSGDGGLFGSMLKGLGIGGENNIEYRERPPLVVPPTRDLPPPQPAGAARNPNWPVDPKSADVPKKGNQVRDLDKLPVPQRPAVPSVAVSNPPGPSANGSEPTATAPPSEPGFFGKLFSSGDMPAAGAIIPVPTRKNLTEPPLDYESPSTGQPYGGATPAAPAKTTPESALQAGQTAPRPGGL